MSKQEVIERLVRTCEGLGGEVLDVGEHHVACKFEKNHMDDTVSAWKRELLEDEVERLVTQSFRLLH